MVCPGGAYQILAIEHEGEDVCKWLNEIGVHAIASKIPGAHAEETENHMRLLYRMPNGRLG